MADPGLGRTEFSLAVATQYLVWGIAGPIAGLVADRWGQRRTLVAGGLSYALGFLAASGATDFTDFWWSAGILIGLGLGGASFGVVHAAVARAWPQEHRGKALGLVGACTALGQLLLLLFTQISVSELGWREALLWHAAAVAMIVPLALMLGKRPTELPTAQRVESCWDDLGSAPFLGLALPFAASGFQVMATMTHLPAITADAGLPGSTALHALVAVSATAFIGSWVSGHLADRYGPQRLLTAVYTVRAVLAFAALLLPAEPLAMVSYFALLGLFWMSPIPLTSALCAQRFGNARLATLFGVAFCFHQAGGFLGTWLAAPVRQATGTYAPMWLVFALLCTAAAACVYQPRSSRLAQG